MIGKDFDPGPVTCYLALVNVSLVFLAYMMDTDVLALSVRYCEDSSPGCPPASHGWYGENVGV